MFGSLRITVKTPWVSGIINIERESEMSGPTHTRGLHPRRLLRGNMRRTNDHHDASICFEQSYSGVTETALLDGSLRPAFKPFRVAHTAGTAVTGSVNQKGRFSPSGCHEKIEDSSTSAAKD